MFRLPFSRSPLAIISTGTRRLVSDRLSIAWLLVVAFIAVAALAAAANYIAARGHAVTRTTQIRTASAPSVPVSVPRPMVQTELVRGTEAAEQSTRNLEIALDRYDSAVLARAQAESTRNVTQLTAAENNLQRALAFFATQTASSEEAAPLGKALGAHRVAATSLISKTDQRRAAFAAYTSQFETMNGHMKQSVDRAWKIFGRVVARQSLIQLSNELDEIRLRFAELSSVGITEATVAALVASESAFARTLADNESSLVRSQGVAWVRTMREDLQSLVEGRAALETAEAEQRKAGGGFAVTNAKARAVLARSVAAPASPTPAPEQTVRMAPMSSPQVQPPSVSDAGRSIEIISASPATNSRHLIAWLTAGVLAILVVICVATVLSIVRPVKRMLAATAQLGRGEAVAVPRGGIKELDTLAAAFNQMAQEVTATREGMRDYQAKLEARVDERTRQLQELAEQDPLTHLPNRRQFFINLDAALQQAANDRVKLGVFFLDLDNFKHINDSMGHGFGDRIILAVAEKLRQFTRHLGFAARLGGDEFTIVMTRAAHAGEVEAAGQALIAAFHQPLLIDNRELVLSVSIGASVYPDHEQTGDSLLRAADVALFRAKTLGRSQLAMFTPELLAMAAAKFATEQGLRRALEHAEFELVFQPELSAEHFKTVLVEALIRWRMPDGRLATPGEFLAVAEESGLIIEISEWVLQAAIQAAARWHHGAWPDVCVAINVSPRQLLDTHFVAKIQGLLQQFNLPPSCIEIELTETVVQTSPRVVQTLRRLHDSGIAIALDDFGTGYSSLSSLEQLPLTRIKLDRSLIARIDTNARSLAITQAIIAMCKGLGLKVTAEGIERPEQFNLLVQHRAMYLQGYLLSRPVAESEVIATLADAERRARLLTETNAAVLLRDSSAESTRAQA